MGLKRKRENYWSENDLADSPQNTMWIVWWARHKYKLRMGFHWTLINLGEKLESD